MSLFWTIIFLNLAFGIKYLEVEGKNQKKFPFAVVVGTVYCDTCFQQDFPKTNHFIAGASVAVECKDTRSTFRQEVKTNKLGEFRVHLPFFVSKKVRRIKGCSVKLIRSSEPYCSVAATATSNSLHLKSTKEGMHIFSAGFFTFKPLNQPSVCAQKPSIRNFKKQNNDDQKSSVFNPNDPTFLPPIQDPPSDQPPHLGQFLPPLPSLPRLPPLPQLPRLPPLPGLPYMPPVPKKIATKESQSSGDNKINQPASIPLPTNPLNPPSIFPPNPLQPPTSLLPPNPFQPPPSIIPPVFPSPPPSIFPPFFPSPPSPPFFHLPPIPVLTPSPPPPPPPFSLIPFPPFPFQPTPGFPGVPPADVSPRSKTNSP